ncbi:CoA-transferase family III domain-containing protein [Stachybotrys elegans]|uniref:CoA-transferase family III domain-containing protein n=1 Tax=Stachybotrys elegans TaxID=80388 RepID=A0A8K0WV43_9HYPO|nr:CoA-transferase family III domain-containing protein [Stachybotrys elegans]
MAVSYSVPEEARRVLDTGILKNPRLAHNIPDGAAEIALKRVKFVGNDQPSVPISWRFSESISALKGYEASVLSLLIQKKYKVDPGDILIDTDHACLFFMSPLIAQIIGEDGKPKPFNPIDPSNFKIIPNCDKHDSMSLYRGLATSIYKTKDSRYFHVHGSLNADPSLTALGLPTQDPSVADLDTAVARIQEKVEQFTSTNIDDLMNEEYKQAGCIALTKEEYFSSESGKANYDAGLYEIKKFHDDLPATWWPEVESKPSSARRPLAGLKVVDLTRIIAGPSITRSLAEMGASVMRVTGPDTTDLSAVHHDLNWGKWNSHLDLKKAEDKEKLWALIQDADVVLDGYRPGVLEKHGFGREAVFESIRGRGRGIIYARENCYGWHGPWAHRSGWQQISDACCGISSGFGRAMGLDEPVTPVFPNSDFCTGVMGSVGILHALIMRAEQGGSFSVDTALNYYSAWLAESVGEYPADVWADLWERHNKPVLRHYENMQHMFAKLLPLMYMKDGQILFKPQFFEGRRAGAVGATFVLPKPISQFTENTVDLRFDVGTRGNGVDAPVWPTDLNVEVVKA